LSIARPVAGLFVAQTRNGLEKLNGGSVRRQSDASGIRSGTFVKLTQSGADLFA
jgi:hypothetical protein